jgi:hypothetical protein
MKMSGQEVVECGHTGNDLVAVVRHDFGRLKYLVYDGRRWRMLIEVE